MAWRDETADRADLTTASGNGGRDSRSFACTPCSARSARTFVCQSLMRHGAPRPLTDDFELVVSELTANAIEHGIGSDISVTVDFTDSRWWVVEIAGSCDHVDEHVLNPDGWTVAGPDARTGRGLGITRALMDDVATKIESRWLTVRCRRSAAITQRA